MKNKQMSINFGNLLRLSLPSIILTCLFKTLFVGKNTGTGTSAMYTNFKSSYSRLSGKGGVNMLGIAILARQARKIPKNRPFLGSPQAQKINDLEFYYITVYVYGY